MSQGSIFQICDPLSVRDWMYTALCCTTAASPCHCCPHNFHVEAHQQPIQGFLSGCPPIWDQESVPGWKIFHLPAGSTLVFTASEPPWVFQILVSVNQVSSELRTVHIWKNPAVRLRTQESLGRGSTTPIFTLKKHFGRDFPEVILVDEWGQQGELVGVTQNPDWSGWKTTGRGLSAPGMLEGQAGRRKGRRLPCPILDHIHTPDDYSTCITLRTLGQSNHRGFTLMKSSSYSLNPHRN